MNCGNTLMVSLSAANTSDLKLGSKSIELMEVKKGAGVTSSVVMALSRTVLGVVGLATLKLKFHRTKLPSLEQDIK